MDRCGRRLIRGVAAASVSVFLVAGAAFAANSVMGPPNVGPDFAPAAAVRSPLGVSNVAKPTETAKPAEAAEAAKPAEAARPARSAKPAEKAEPAETNHGGDRGDGGSSHDQGGADQGGNG